MKMTSEQFKQMILNNGKKFFSVDFIKKDGTLRTLNGHIRAVQGHDGANPTSHIPKYITVVLAQKDSNGKEQFRNVNTESIKRLAIAGKTIYNQDSF